MDNLAHALVGACIGRASAGKRLPAAGWLGAVAANAPDWTEPFVGLRLGRGDVSYYVIHRGITHSLAGAVVQTLAIGTLWLAALAWRARARQRPAPPISVLFGTVACAVLSHLYMDWQGSYGLRWLLPWSGRWTYADWVAIVDPFFWLVPLIALAWGEKRIWRDALPYVLIWLLVTWVIVRAPFASAWVLPVYLTIGLIGVAGWSGHWFGWGQRHRAAGLALLALAAYAGAHAIASLPAKARVRDDAVRRFGPGAQWAALTMVGRPFEWEPMIASPDSVAGPDWEAARNLDLPDVQRALETPAGRAMAGFARFLAAEVDSEPGGAAVIVRDARYSPDGRSGWAVVRVPLGTVPAKR